MKHFVKALTLALFLCLLCALMLTSCGKSTDGTNSDGGAATPPAETESKPASVGLSIVFDETLNAYAVAGIGDCQDTDIVIPKEYNGKAVLAIQEQAFSNCKNITSVTIPEGITTIGVSAFEYCEKLTSIVIPKSVKTINNFAFNNCRNLASITLPDSPMAIGSGVFNGTAYYDNIDNWYDYTLYIGKHLIKAHQIIPIGRIKSGTLSIADAAFGACGEMREVIIPDSVVIVGRDAFIGCRELQVIRCAVSTQPDGWHTEWNNGLTNSTEIIWG